MNVSPHCRLGFRHCEPTKQETSCLLTNTPSGALIMSIGDETWSLPAGVLGCAACCVGCFHCRNHWSSIVNHDNRLVGACETGMMLQYYSEIFLDCINIIIAARYIIALLLSKFLSRKNNFTRWPYLQRLIHQLLYSYFSYVWIFIFIFIELWFGVCSLASIAV